MDNWDLLLPAAAFAHNISMHSSISNTPFYLNHGRHPRMPFMSDLDHSDATHIPAAHDLASHLQETINRAKTAMQAAQQRRQAYYNQNRPDVTFVPNQM
eukprot:scaffold33686_cov46-Tisochrysis_lutea.AAC.1